MIPGFEVVQGNSAGAFTGGGNKLCLHTTEGSTIEGAVGAYRKNNSWPHFTIDPVRKRKMQHLEVNVAARSLSNNPSDGYEVGRANVVQVEITGFSKDAPNWPKERLDWIAGVLSEIRKHFSFPLFHPVFKVGATVFSDRDWVSYTGIVGHQHAPDNKNGHWDPGALDVPYIVSKMGGSTAPSTSKGITVNTFKAYNSTITLDKDGNGYVDVVHNTGKDPVISLAQANGNDPAKEGYPKTGNITFLTSGYAGKYVRVTVVAGKPYASFGIKTLLAWQ